MFVASTTTPKAAGLDFTATGGKKQGREVLQSLKTARWNPALAGFGKANYLSLQQKKLPAEKKLVFLQPGFEIVFFLELR